MKSIKEENKLPIVFDYLEIKIKPKNKEVKYNNSSMQYLLSCKKFQTDYYVREKSVKPLVRFL